MTFLCNGQRLRDTYMAYNIAKILEHNDSTVVVIVGIAHAVKLAVPQILNQYTPLPYKVILPESVKHIFEKRLDSGITDYIWY
jgi:pheromone shutdown protein TraB